MSDETPKADRAAGKPRPAQSSPDETPEERRYSNDELRASARQLLNASPHAVAGALAASSKKTHTLEEAAKLVQNFLSRKTQPKAEES